MATADKRRQEILDFAKSLDGAHYLWGAEALRPSRTQAGAFAPVVLSKDRTKETCFCAATNSFDQLNVCAGRSARMTGGGLIAAPESDTLLNAFIERYAGKPHSQYGWGSELTPRLVKGKDIMDYRKGLNLTDKVVWGEGCDDTLHFDCGGFVRYVVNQVCGVVIKGISMLPDPATMKTPKGTPMASKVNAGETIMPADILVYDGHIAFATGDNKPVYIEQSTSSYQVAQAESATEGVNYGKSHTGKAKKCIRLSDDALTFKS